MNHEASGWDSAPDLDHASMRLISQVLTMYYIEEQTQSVIAKTLDISTAKVSRLLKYAREHDMVEIRIKTPFHHVSTMEKKLEAMSALRKAIVVPGLTESGETLLMSVGKAAAEYLLERVKKGMAIGVGGGHTLNVVFNEIPHGQQLDINAVPCIGGVSGKLENSTNYLSEDLAQRLGGSALHLHAPAFVENKQARDSLMQLDHVRETLDVARAADIALVVVGAVDPQKSSFLKFTNLPTEELQSVIEETNAAGEITSHMFDTNGQLCAPSYSQRVVGLTLEEVCAVPETIGVAALPSKVKPVAAAIKGELIDTLVTDEQTASSVITLLEAGW